VRHRTRPPHAPPFCAKKGKTAKREPEHTKRGQHTKRNQNQPKEEPPSQTINLNQKAPIKSLLSVKTSTEKNRKTSKIKSEPESTNKIIAFGQDFDRKEPKNLDAFLKCHLINLPIIPLLAPPRPRNMPPSKCWRTSTGIMKVFST
jgi:hypothetical protein